MSKAIEENMLIIVIKDFCKNLIYIVNYFPPSTLVAVFLIAEKLLSL